MSRKSIGSRTITVIPLATGSGGIVYKEFAVRKGPSLAPSGYVELTIGETFGVNSVEFDAQFSSSKFYSGGSTIPSQNTQLVFAGGTEFAYGGPAVIHLPLANTAEENAAKLAEEITYQKTRYGFAPDPNNPNGPEIEIDLGRWAWDGRIKNGEPKVLEIRAPDLASNELLEVVSHTTQHRGWDYKNIPADAGGAEVTQAVSRQVFDKGDIVKFDDTYFIYDGDNRLITDKYTALPVDGEVWEQISDSTDRFVHAFNNWNGRIAYKKDNIVTYNGLFIRTVGQAPDWVFGQYYSFGNIVAYEGLLFERNITSLTLDPEIIPTEDTHWIPSAEGEPSIENANWDTFLTASLGDVRYQGALTAGANISIDTADTISVIDVYTKDEVDGIVNSWADYAIGGVYVSQSRNLSDNGLIITLDYAGGQVFREILDDGSLDRIYNTNTDGVLTDLLKTRGG